MWETDQCTAAMYKQKVTLEGQPDCKSEGKACTISPEAATPRELGK